MATGVVPSELVMASKHPKTGIFREKIGIFVNEGEKLRHLDKKIKNPKNGPVACAMNEKDAPLSNPQSTPHFGCMSLDTGAVPSELVKESLQPKEGREIVREKIGLFDLAAVVWK